MTKRPYFYSPLPQRTESYTALTRLQREFLPSLDILRDADDSPGFAPSALPDVVSDLEDIAFLVVYSPERDDFTTREFAPVGKRLYEPIRDALLAANCPAILRLPSQDVFYRIRELKSASHIEIVTDYDDFFRQASNFKREYLPPPKKPRGPDTSGMCFKPV